MTQKFKTVKAWAVVHENIDSFGDSICFCGDCKGIYLTKEDAQKWMKFANPKLVRVEIREIRPLKARRK